MSKYLKDAIKIIEARDPFLGGGATRADFGDDFSGGYPDEFYPAADEVEAGDDDLKSDADANYENLMTRFDRVQEEMTDEEGDAWDSAMNAADAQLEYGDQERADAYLAKAEDVLDQVEQRLTQGRRQGKFE